MPEAVLDGYAAEAGDLAERFDVIDSAEVYAPVAGLLPAAPASILDVGAGTGRDAAWLAAQGHRVLAVEPVASLRAFGQARHASSRIAWMDDRLPGLARVLARRERFDRVILTGVWQHLDGDERPPAMANLAALIAAGGRLIVSVRHGPGAATRPCYAAPPDEAIALAENAGLDLVARRAAPAVQPANRAAGVSWTWLAFSPRAA